MKHLTEVDSVLADVEDEIVAATEKYGPFMSTHEGYGVLAEEVAELLEAIRANAMESVRSEAIQVSAVAARLAACVRENGEFRARSGG